MVALLFVFACGDKSDKPAKGDEAAAKASEADRTGRGLRVFDVLAHGIPSDRLPTVAAAVGATRCKQGRGVFQCAYRLLGADGDASLRMINKRFRAMTMTLRLRSKRNVAQQAVERVFAGLRSYGPVRAWGKGNVTVPQAFDRVSGVSKGPVIYRKSGRVVGFAFADEKSGRLSASLAYAVGTGEYTLEMSWVPAKPAGKHARLLGAEVAGFARSAGGIEGRVTYTSAGKGAVPVVVDVVASGCGDCPSLSLAAWKAKLPTLRAELLGPEGAADKSNLLELEEVDLGRVRAIARYQRYRVEIPSATGKRERYGNSYELLFHDGRRRVRVIAVGKPSPGGPDAVPIARVALRKSAIEVARQVASNF
jgi:hypothetical protein